MQGHSTDEVATLARAVGLDIGDEAEAVTERFAQLVGFARELEGLVGDECEIDAAFDPTWDAPR